MKKHVSILKCLLGLGLFTFCSCQKENVQDDLQSTAEQGKVTEELRQALWDKGLNGDMVTPLEFNNEEGMLEQAFLVGGDILMTEEEIMQPAEVVLDKKGPSTKKNFRTTNLVTNLPRVIRIKGIVNTAKGLNFRERQALREAVREYNDLNLDLSFNLSFGERRGNAEIIVQRDDNFLPPEFSDFPGGIAEFPKDNGNPGRRIRVFNTRPELITRTVLKHVLVHEIGHCVGFRHTDYRTRRSCGGERVNEGQAGVGAIAIPGTTPGFDPTSVMLACFNDDSTGELNTNDVTALRFLYQD